MTYLPAGLIHDIAMYSRYGTATGTRGISHPIFFMYESLVIARPGITPLFWGKPMGRTDQKSYEAEPCS